MPLAGGVSRMEISGREVSLGGAALEIHGVVDYPVCADRPCQNGAACRPAPTPYGYQCVCREGYSGQRCELVGEHCFEGRSSSSFS